jgi:hypothetical protein
MNRLDNVVPDGAVEVEADVVAIDVVDEVPPTILVIDCDGLGPRDREMGNMVVAK